MWLPDYEKIVVSTDRTGTAPRRPDSPGRIVLHTTEGLRLYDYPYPPHFTLAVVGDPHSLPAGKAWYTGKAGMLSYPAGTRMRHQHCDLALTSYALLHRSTDPETNHEGAHCVQVEIISTASTPPQWSDAMYGLVASWLADVVEALPGLAPALDNYPDRWSAQGSWGFNTPYRMSWDTWQKGLNGKPFLCGHQHVPGNDHWDPGALDVVKLTRMAKGILGSATLEEDGPDVASWRLAKRIRVLRRRVDRLQERLVVADHRLRHVETNRP